LKATPNSVILGFPTCYPYRQQVEDESDYDLVSRKAKELDDEFLRLGLKTVAAFIAESVVGTPTLGGVPYVPGYLMAMRDVCHKYGTLFILDKVMCGMGRTGTLHAWQANNVVPDIQTNAKGLGAGYQPIAALMIYEEVVNVLKQGSGEFIHGGKARSAKRKADLRGYACTDSCFAGSANHPVRKFAGQCL